MERDYSDTLRVVGRFLEEQRASAVKIVDAGDRLSVSWVGQEGTPKERGYRSFELEELRAKARLMRSSSEGTPPISMSEILRLLGWALDNLGADLVSIVDDPAGLRLTANIGEKRASRTYSRAELLKLIEEQRGGRGLARAPLLARAVGPYLDG